jgi:hypothetical protein
MKQLAVIILSVMMLSVAFVGVASAQQVSRTANLTAFNASMNFMSEAGYLRYLNHQQTGQWTPFAP